MELHYPRDTTTKLKIPNALDHEGSPKKQNRLHGTRKLNPKMVPVSKKKGRITGEFYNSMRDMLSLTP